MCIICNLMKTGKEEEGVLIADEFLDSFKAARQAMKRATDAMLACSKIDRRYDGIHKKMVALCRAWNKIEEQREAGRSHK